MIRYEGPRGGPGMREMLSVTAALAGRGMDKEVALITDGRFLALLVEHPSDIAPLRLQSVDQLPLCKMATVFQLI